MNNEMVVSKSLEQAKRNGAVHTLKPTAGNALKNATDHLRLLKMHSEER